MVPRVGLVAVVSLILGMAGVAVATGPQPAVGRPDVLEVGEPVLLGRELLLREMNSNRALSEYIEKYGWPDYAVVQRTAVEEPYISFAPYEVRIYYVQRDQEIIFGRVAISEAMHSFGIRKWLGPIRPETMDWLLTASAPARTAPVAATEPEAYQPAAPQVIAAAEPATGSVTTEDLIARMEAAAERAAAAAEAAVVASRDAEAAANRAAETIESWASR